MTEHKRIWTPEDIPKDVPLYKQALEWAECGRSSEQIWAVINFLTHFKKDEYK